MSDQKPFDLDAYLERIRYAGSRDASESTLVALHEAHLASVPFENLDVRLGRPVSLDPEALEAKLVRGGRGGYCFEQNALFAGALRTLGFAVATLEARVRTPGARGPRPRTHMVLTVDVAGEGGRRTLLADVGFGGDGPRRPVPLDGTLSDDGDANQYRVEAEEGGLHVLRRCWRGEWSDLYAFTRSPVLPVDYEVAHHYTAHHPRSPFVLYLTAQITKADTRHILRGRTYLVRQAGEETTREVSEAEVTGLLRDVFGLHVPPDDVRQALAGIPETGT